MLDAFYTAMSPAALALLGLWLVAVQMRAEEVKRSAGLVRRTYGVALSFALPGLMSVMALIQSDNPWYWRATFAVLGVVGAVVLFPSRGLPGSTRARTAADILSVILYLAIAVLGLLGGVREERAAAVLLVVVVFLGFNVAWLFLFAPLGEEDRPEPPQTRAQASTSSR